MNYPTPTMIAAERLVRYTLRAYQSSPTSARYCGAALHGTMEERQRAWKSIEVEHALYVHGVEAMERELKNLMN